MSGNLVLNELRSDLKELESILTSVVRSNVRGIIANEITLLRGKIELLEQEEEKLNKASKSDEDSEKITSKPTLYTAKISTYGWDESSKFVKLYVSLKDIEKLTAEQIACEFSDCSFKFTAHNHAGKNHMLQILRLAHKIKPEDSWCKIKPGNVVIALRKAKDSETWGNVTEAERKEKEAKDAKYSDNKDDSDPSSGIMNLMKKMYDEGDDDMKRMLKKTWYETQQKQTSGEMPTMPSL